MRKFISMILCLGLIFGVTCFSFAETGTIESNEGTFEFVSGPERIDSSGNFTFEYRSSLKSTTFQVNKATTTISFQANIIRRADGKNVNNMYPNLKCIVQLYDKTTGKVVASTTVWPDGSEYTFEGNGLSTKNTYYLSFSTAGQALPAGTNVTGSGSITNYK